MDPQEQSRGQSAGRQNLWGLGLIIALGFLIIVLCGYTFGWKWTGLVTDDNYPKRTFWDWLDLLIVPIVLAIGGYLFTRSENQATQAAAERRAQDEALQAYLDQIGQLLLDENRPLRQTDDDAVRTLARARTSTVLTRLGGARKGSVVRFLYESGLITKDDPVLILDEVDLKQADLSGANLSRADLSGAILIGANLSHANLSEALLHHANLRSANLRDAGLHGASFRGADLSEANLVRNDLHRANLSGANLSGALLHHANLHGANLSGANLGGAILHRVDLSGAEGWTDMQLRTARSLTGATMPDGHRLTSEYENNDNTYEKWLKDRKALEEDGRTNKPRSGEDGENADRG